MVYFHGLAGFRERQLEVAELEVDFALARQHPGEFVLVARRLENLAGRGELFQGGLVVTERAVDETEQKKRVGGVHGVIPAEHEAAGVIAQGRRAGEIAGVDDGLPGGVQRVAELGVIPQGRRRIGEQAVPRVVVRGGDEAGRERFEFRWIGRRQGIGARGPGGPGNASDARLNHRKSCRFNRRTGEKEGTPGAPWLQPPPQASENRRSLEEAVRAQKQEILRGGVRFKKKRS